VAARPHARNCAGIEAVHGRCAKPCGQAPDARLRACPAAAADRLARRKQGRAGLVRTLEEPITNG